MKKISNYGSEPYSLSLNLIIHIYSTVIAKQGRLLGMNKVSQAIGPKKILLVITKPCFVATQPHLVKLLDHHPNPFY